MSAAGSFRGKGDCGRDASNRGKQKWLVALEGKKKLDKHLFFSPPL
jgi:hypothetical protein